jgi:mono/diheme cytochrome c family protein
MRRLIASAVVALIFRAIALPAGAQPGNPQAGKQLALHDCAVCHIVAARQQTKPLVSGYGPSFFDIAERPGTTEQSLQQLLAHGHPRSNMPAPGLTTTQVRDVVSYILSLRGER